jgi:hypothetical protein
MNATIHGLTGAIVFLSVSRSEPGALKACVKASAYSLITHPLLDVIPHIEPASLGLDYIQTFSAGWWWALTDNIFMALSLLMAAFFIRKLISVGAVVSVVFSWLPDAVQLGIYHLPNSSFKARYSQIHNGLHAWRSVPALNNLYVDWACSLLTFTFCYFILSGLAPRAVKEESKTPLSLAVAS